jgi:subtilisin family serine protease
LDQWFDDSEQIKIGTNFGGRYVQLLAPGESIYSAGHDNGYSRATGSSQAVPQVTAAAAVLYAQGHTEPWRIKLRLMYTD